MERSIPKGYVKRTERLPDTDSQLFVVTLKRGSIPSNGKGFVVGERATTEALPKCQQIFPLVRAFDSGTLEPPKVHGIRMQASCLAFRDIVGLKERVVRVLAPQRSLGVSHGGHQ